MRCRSAKLSGWAHEIRASNQPDGDSVTQLNSAEAYWKYSLLHLNRSEESFHRAQLGSRNTVVQVVNNSRGAATPADCGNKVFAQCS